MSLVSLAFAVFLLISLVSYYLVPKKFQWILLCLANIFFYAVSGISNFIYILWTAFTTFFAAKIVSDLNFSLKEKKSVLEKEAFKLEKKKNQNKKRIVLFIMLLLNVGILVFLKYINVLFIHMSLLLPLGISYYTLQTIAYFMDVYNSRYEREHNFIRYFSFVSFFPQLLMGPINRYSDLGKQMKEEHKFDFENIKKGVMLILYGAFKKYLIADMLFIRVTAILDKPYDNLPGCLIVAGVLMYAFYQYADFSGGVDMVSGVAKLFGLNMAPNFKQPYFSTSLSNFWQRWHISLGSWMRDYIFYPFALTKGMQNLSKWCNSHLGKHFAKTLPAGIANIVVFMLVGVWHGPELHFFVWGLYNGIIIALSDLFSPLFDKMNRILHVNVKSKAWHVFQVLRTFIVVNIGWYFDHMEDVPRSFLYLKRTFTDFGNPVKVFKRDYLLTIFGHITDFESQIILVAIGLITVLVISLMKENKIDVYEAIQKKNIAFRWACYYIPLILIILSFSFSSGDAGFMYAQY